MPDDLDPDDLEPLIPAARLHKIARGRLDAVPSDQLEELLASASSTIRDAAGWHIAPEITETVTVDGSGGYELILPTLRLLEITGAAQRQAGAGQLARPVPLDRLEPSRSGVVTLAGGPWSSRRGGVQVTMRHGYRVAPGSVARLVTKVVARFALVPLAAIRETAGPISVEWEREELLDAEREVLAHYTIGNPP